MTAKSGQTHRPELGPEALHQAEVNAKWRVGEVVLGVHEPNPRVTLQLHCGDVVIQENQRRVGARRRAFNEARFSRRQLVLGPSLLSLGPRPRLFFPSRWVAYLFRVRFPFRVWDPLKRSISIPALLHGAVARRL